MVQRLLRRRLLSLFAGAESPGSFLGTAPRIARRLVAPPDQIQPVRRSELSTAEFQIRGLRLSRGADAWPAGRPSDGFRYRIPYKFIPKTTILNDLSAFVPPSKNQQFPYRLHRPRRRENNFEQFLGRVSTKFDGIVTCRRQNYDPANWFSLKNFPFALRQFFGPALSLSMGRVGDLSVKRRL
jgi:hypothetical protein